MFIFLILVKVYKHNMKHNKYILNNMGIAQSATAYQQQEAHQCGYSLEHNSSIIVL